MIGAIHFSQVAAQACAFPAQLLRAIRLAPYRLVLEFEADLFETLALGVVLKETPSRMRRAPRDLSSCA